MPWQWERLLQLAANGLRSDDPAQNESDSLVIRDAGEWLSKHGELR